jgi:putative hydrolase of the HAD superfamily
MHNIKAVLFDLDNTLIDRNKAFVKYCNWFIDEYFHGSVVPDKKENMIALMVLLDENGYGNRRIKMYNELIEKWCLFNYSTEELVEKWENVFASFICINEKTNKLLKYFKEKYKLGLITNGRSQLQQSKIDAAGIRIFFDVIIVSDEVGIKKPERAIFEMACSKLNVDVHDAVFIGDHMQNDVIGATNAGLQAVWLNYKKLQNQSKICYNEIFKIDDLMGIL